MVGLRQDRKSKGRFGKLSPTYYLRYYHGVNPNGQFRSQSHYTEFGFGVQLLAPAASDIQKYDADIYTSRDAALGRIMNEMNIPSDLPTKSQILQYSNPGPGGSVEEMIRSACRYYLNTVNL